jgi:hypothetical protein
MLICSILIPIIMILFGRFMWKRLPKKINWIFGYRTPMSMKNLDTWEFAQEYSGRIWWKIGWILMLLSVATIIIVQLISADASALRRL